MKEELGILTHKVEEWGGDQVDKLLKLPPYLEPFDGFFATQTLRGIDNHYGEKISDPYKTQIRERLDEIIIEQDYDTAVTKGMEFIDSLVDIPGIDDPTEAMIFQGLARIIVGLILGRKKK